MHIRSCWLSCPKCTWIAENALKFLYSMEWGKQVQESELHWWNLECAQKNGKTDISCCKHRILSVKNSIYFSRAMDVDLALSITEQQAFGSWGELKLQSWAFTSTPHPSPTSKRFPREALGFEWATQSLQLIKEDILLQSLFLGFTLENRMGYKGDNPVNSLQSLLSSPGISLHSPSRLT